MSGTPSGASLRLDSLTKRYPRSAGPAVDEISLTIAPGEFMTFLGPSGSGKTTTLNMIAGFTDVTSGALLINGRDVARVPSHKRDLGVVFQHYALFPHLTVAENIAFPLRQRKVPRSLIKERVADALRLVHLAGLGDRHPRELSGGQQQRVAFARAVVFQPKVLLMDEPLGALDKGLREELQVEIARIHRELGITFVYVTHDQEEALALSDRIAVFNDGRIDQVGTPEHLYEAPASLFVARFLGDSTTLSGHIGPDGTTLLRNDGTRIAVSPTGLPPGTAAAVVVRPERLTVEPRGAALPGGGAGVRLEAVVSEVIYLGSSRRIILQLPDGGRAVAREPLGGCGAVQRGDPVVVAWDVAGGYVVAEGDVPSQVGAP